MKLKKYERSEKSRKAGVALGLLSSVVLLGVAVTAIATPLAVRKYSAINSETTPNQFEYNNAYDLVISAQQNNNNTVTLNAPFIKNFFQVNSSSLSYRWYQVNSIQNGKIYSSPVLGPVSQSSPQNPVNHNFLNQNYVQTTQSITVYQTNKAQTFYVTMSYPGFGKNVAYTSPLITIPPFGQNYEITVNQAVADAVANKFFNKSKQYINVAEISSLSKLTLNQFSQTGTDYTNGVNALQTYIRNDLIQNGITVNIKVIVANGEVQDQQVKVSANDISIANTQIMQIGDLLYVYLTYKASSFTPGTGRVPLVFGNFAENSSTTNPSNTTSQK